MSRLNRDLKGRPGEELYRAISSIDVAEQIERRRTRVRDEEVTKSIEGHPRRPLQLSVDGRDIVVGPHPAASGNRIDRSRSYLNTTNRHRSTAQIDEADSSKVIIRQEDAPGVNRERDTPELSATGNVQECR